MRRAAPTLLPAVATLPLLMMAVSVVVGGGPRAESADDALLTLAMRDASHGHGLIGPYSRFGWHHPGPSYLYWAGVPTRLWGGGPTGSWLGAIALGGASVAGLVLLVRRWAGRRAAWWTAAASLAVVVGLGPNVFRDPWNPYAVTLPMLFTIVVAGFTIAGAKGAFGWAAVGGTIAVQTHVSTAPVVGALLGAAVVAVVVRRRTQRQGLHRTDIPGSLPPLASDARPTPWYRREVTITAALLALAWLPPLWDEAFGTHNLTAIWDFFTSSHPGHPWGESWRLVTAMFGAVLFQHHAALHDGVADPHPLLTSLVFLALVAVAVVVGQRRHRPAAVWLGAGALLSAGLCVYSVTRVVGVPYRYLLVWMAVIPVMPAVGVAIGLAGRRAAHAKRKVSLEVAAIVAVVAVIAVASVVSVIDLRPAVALTDNDVVRAWNFIEPVIGPAHGAVHLELADGARWPSAAGIALQLERAGHPTHVDPPWTLLFGADRRATGKETKVIIIGDVDSGTWPPPSQATLLGVAGKASYFEPVPAGAVARVPAGAVARVPAGAVARVPAGQ